MSNAAGQNGSATAALALATLADEMTATLQCAAAAVVRRTLRPGCLPYPFSRQARIGLLKG